MKISGDMLSIASSPIVTDLGESAQTTGSSVVSSLAGIIDKVGIDSTTATAFLGTAGIMKDSFFGLSNAYSSVKSFNQWMQGDQPLTGGSLTTLAHGLNAMTLLDKVGGTVVGLGNYTGIAGGFVNLAKVVSGVQQGNLSQVAFSGAKLCVSVALAGNPAAGIAIASAEFLYNKMTK
jgi:hypothetical protein